jgi:hypothetical protein
VVATLKGALLPDDGSLAMTFTSSEQVLAYLGSRVVGPIWRDPVCGDSKCEQPWEFPSFGRCGPRRWLPLAQPCQGLCFPLGCWAAAAAAQLLGEPAC